MANRSFVVAVDENNPKTKYRLMVEVPDGSGTTYKASKTRQASLGSKERMEQVAESRNSKERFDDVFYIDSREVLDEVVSLINAGTFEFEEVKLVADIDLSGEEFTPIDNLNKPFIFDGQGYSIKNMTVRKAHAPGSTTYGGGFIENCTSKVTIKNVNFVNADVAITQKALEDQESFTKSGNVVGIVMGYAYGETLFENVNVINSIVRGYGKIGAILGMGAQPGMKVTFRNCGVSSTTVRGATNCGGLAGCIQRGKNKVLGENFIVENCNVTATWVKDPASEYIDVDTVTSEECNSLNEGASVKGTYLLYPSDDIIYLFGAFSNCGIDFGDGDSEPKLQSMDEKYRLANGEICLI